MRSIAARLLILAAIDLIPLPGLGQTPVQQREAVIAWRQLQLPPQVFGCLRRNFNIFPMDLARQFGTYPSDSQVIGPVNTCGTWFQRWQVTPWTGTRLFATRVGETSSDTPSVTSFFTGGRARNVSERYRQPHSMGKLVQRLERRRKDRGFLLGWAAFPAEPRFLQSNERCV